MKTKRLNEFRIFHANPTLLIRHGKKRKNGQRSYFELQD